MIIFLYGPDGYRLKENVDTIVGAYRKKNQNGLSYYRFDFDPALAGKGGVGGGNHFDDLANAVKNVSFFDEAKLIVVKNLFSAGNGLSDKIIRMMDEFETAADKRTVLVFIEDKGQKELQKTGKELFALLISKPNLVRNVEYLNGIKLRNWVVGEFKKYGHGVSINAAGLLVNFVGNESWALANEIEKLCNYSMAVVTENDVNLLVVRKEDSTIFNLVDAVGGKNTAGAFETIFRLMHAGYDPHYILSMLVYHFENLLSVSDLLEKEGPLPSSLIAKKCGLHPFVAQKAVRQAGKFQKGELKARFGHLAGLDVASKDGRVNLEDALYVFMVSQ